jgi:hypothetical protein
MIDNSSISWQKREFRKSSFSGGANSSCVELAWRKSSFSGGQNNSCVEVARGEALFGIRDSKNVAGPVLMLAEVQGRAFLAAVKRFS